MYPRDLESGFLACGAGDRRWVSRIGGCVCGVAELTPVPISAKDLRKHCNLAL